MPKNPSELPEGIFWPNLVSGTLIRRYKRFLADVQLENGETVTAHCPNSGSMKSYSEQGRPVYLSHHENPKRKLKYTWELIQMPNSLVGINTNIPNQLVKKAVSRVEIKELSGYQNLQSEVKVGEHSRLDLYLKSSDSRECYIEIKNCTLVEKGRAYFPDAVTTRGRKHLQEMIGLLGSKKRCVMFFLVQRTDAKYFHPAEHIDPKYAKELARAAKEGVEILVYDVCIDLGKIALNRPVAFNLAT